MLVIGGDIMQEAVVLYFKKKRQAWVARVSKEEKVLLPIENAKVLDGDTMRDLRMNEKRPRPQQGDSLVFVSNGNGTICAWALK